MSFVFKADFYYKINTRMLIAKLIIIHVSAISYQLVPLIPHETNDQTISKLTLKCHLSCIQMYVGNFNLVSKRIKSVTFHHFATLYLLDI